MNMSKIKEKAIEKANQKQKDLTKSEIAEIEKVKISVNDGEMFMHCKHCMQEFMDKKFGVGQSPKEALTYCIASVPLETKNHVTNIVAAFCNRCGRVVWDSRHLKHRY